MTGLALALLVFAFARGRGGSKHPLPRSDEAKNTAVQAAHALRLYLLGGGDPGEPGRLVDNVLRAQRLMGGVRPSGYVDRATRARAAALGASLPPEPKRKGAEQAAEDLSDWLRRTGRFGHAGDRPAEIRRAQRDMGMPARDQDGIIGHRTRERARALGVPLPLRPKSYGQSVSGDLDAEVSGEGGEVDEGQANYDEDSDAVDELSDEELELEEIIRENDLWQVRMQQ